MITCWAPRWSCTHVADVHRQGQRLLFFSHYRGETFTVNLWTVTIDGDGRHLGSLRRLEDLFFRDTLNDWLFIGTAIVSGSE